MKAYKNDFQYEGGKLYGPLDARGSQDYRPKHVGL